MGSSRDWAAKGTSLLGVKAVITKSFERIHRSNLVGMGVLPCNFVNKADYDKVKDLADATFDLIGLSNDLKPSSRPPSASIPRSARPARQCSTSPSSSASTPRWKKTTTAPAASCPTCSRRSWAEVRACFFLPPPMAAATAGFSMPPEWSPQDAVWLSWPVADARHWGGAKHDIMWAKFAEIAAAISRHETVRINAPGTGHAAIAAACNRAKAVPERLELFDHPHNDVWCRDHGPIFVKHQTTGEVAVTDWGFNAWGGKFPPWDLDDAIPGRIAAALGLRVFNGGMILEGGAIEINGTGQLLTTETVLLNPNRNPQLGRSEIEQLLRDWSWRHRYPLAPSRHPG